MELMGSPEELTKAQIYDILLRNGVVTRDEVREALGLNPAKPINTPRSNA